MAFLLEFCNIKNGEFRKKKNSLYMFANILVFLYSCNSEKILNIDEINLKKKKIYFIFLVVKMCPLKIVKGVVKYN